MRVPDCAVPASQPELTRRPSMLQDMLRLGSTSEHVVRIRSPHSFMQVRAPAVRRGYCFVLSKSDNDTIIVNMMRQTPTAV